MKKSIGICIVLFLCFSCKPNKNMLVLVEDGNNNFGYMNSKGDTIIPVGKYSFCLSDTIKEIGFVLSKENGFICIDKKDHFLFQVFNYDNGPDYPSEGLFRIVENGKIGYANLHGKVVIEPQYKCAWPFENGKAKVSYNCNITKKGEYNFWEDGDWFYIYRKGKKESLKE